jgi:hypothetical protein
MNNLNDIVKSINDFKNECNESFENIIFSINGINTQLINISKQLDVTINDDKNIDFEIKSNIAKIELLDSNLEKINSWKLSLDCGYNMPRPTINGVPIQYESATEYHSVSDPIRKKLGYMG